MCVSLILVEKIFLSASSPLREAAAELRHDSTSLSSLLPIQHHNLRPVAFQLSGLFLCLISKSFQPPKLNHQNIGGNPLVNEKQCTTCGTKLVNRRSHARFCSAACRCRAWREAQLTPVSVKIVFARTQLESLRDEATALGILINELIINKATQASAPFVSN